MNAMFFATLADYLSRTPSPDCEFLEGRLVGRNVGEISHGDAQGRTYAFVLSNSPGFWPGVEVRVQVRPDRYRVADVAIVRGGRPAGRIITTPPEIAVEVLSPEDRAADLQDKIDDYLQFGVAAVWVIDPERQRAWIHKPDGAREALNRILRNPAGDLEVPLSAVFAS